jgi:hypothetical protein
MGYFTARERNALGKSVDERAETRPREFARDEFAPRRRPANPEISSLVQQVSDGSVEKIDAVIAELQHRRETILEESMRMCREILAYAKLNQSTMDSTRVISESLASLGKVPDAPAMSELVDAVTDQQDRNSASERFVEAHGRFAPPEGSRLSGARAGGSIPLDREPPEE